MGQLSIDAEGTLRRMIPLQVVIEGSVTDPNPDCQCRKLERLPFAVGTLSSVQELSTLPIIGSEHHPG